MERRTAIKGIALSLGSLVSLPAWASGWSASKMETTSTLSLGNDALLAELVEAIIPTTDTIGAKGLGVHQFIKTMLVDCYEKSAQESFDKILSNIDPLSNKTYGKSFSALDTNQKLDLLKTLSQSTDKETKDFYSTLRGLTIHGYTSSEYYMTHFTDYEIAPGHFYGCVPVKK